MLIDIKISKKFFYWRKKIKLIALRIETEGRAFRRAAMPQRRPAH
ncbi:hypothetical protein [Burkholderia pseudomallei]